jgi:hypothetical protein
MALVFRLVRGQLAVELLADFRSRQTQNFDLGNWQNGNGLVAGSLAG